VPVADAGVGLPWECGDAVEDAAFAVEGAGADGAVVGLLAEVDGFDFAVVFGGADVVDLGDGGVAVLVEGDAAVGVEEVGLVLIDEIFDAAEVLQLPSVGRDAAHGLCGFGEVGGLAGVVVVEIGEGGVGAVVGDAGEWAGGVAEMCGG